MIGVEPGSLTIHLGFLPPSARDVRILDPEGAIIADDTLTGEQKETVLRVIKGLRAASS